MRPTDEQERVMKEALLEHEFIDAVGDEFGAGLMGYQIEAHLTNVDLGGFNLYVEDVDVNCEWYIVQLQSGFYNPDFDDEGLVATIEVKRFPVVDDGSE